MYGSLLSATADCMPKRYEKCFCTAWTFFSEGIVFGCICFFLYLCKRSYLQSGLANFNKILTQGGGVEWLGPCLKWASSVARCGCCLWKTLFLQDYLSLSMNIKKLLQLKYTGLQHIIIILVWTYCLIINYIWR